MSDKEKAHQIAWETSKHYDPLLSKESWCEMAALDMASWKNEQKPTLNEEDIRNIQDIDSILFYDRQLTEDIRKRLRNFLESLKYRVQPQPKQEWSEEDDYILNLVSKFVLKGYKSHPKIPSLEFIQDWLKSIKPNHWKPSEEQIIALRWVLNNIPYNKHKEVISQMVEQFKKF